MIRTDMRRNEREKSACEENRATQWRICSRWRSRGGMAVHNDSWRDMSLVRTEHISSSGCVSKKIEMPQKELIFNHGYGLG